MSSAAGGGSGPGAGQAEELIPLEGSVEPAASGDDGARAKQGYRMSRGRLAAAASVGTLLLGAALLCGAKLRPAPPVTSLESAGGLVTLDDAQAKLATCIIDADQAAFYLMQGVNFIRFAVDSCDVMTDVAARTACGASVTTAIASFGWVGSYTAFAINSCGTEASLPAACAASMSAFVAELGEFGFIASSIVGACDLTTPPEQLPPKSKDLPKQRLLKASEKSHAAQTPHLDAAKSFFERLALQKKLEAEKPGEPEENSLRGWSISQCIVDLNIGVTYVARIGIQTYFLTTECPKTGSNYDRKRCALDIFNVISSVAWAAQFLSLAAFDCPENGSLEAGCAGVVSDFVATVAALGPIVNGIADDCQPMLAGSGAGSADFA